MKEPLWLMTNGSGSRLSPCASIRKPYIPMGLQGHLHIHLSLLLKQRGRPFSLVYICGAISRNVCQGMQHELIQSVASSLQVKHFSQPCSDNWLTIGGSLSLATHIASTSPCLFRQVHVSSERASMMGVESFGRNDKAYIRKDDWQA